jgi:hypothetical protein
VIGQNHTLQDEIHRLTRFQSKITNVQAPVSPKAAGSGFAAHIDLKKQNHDMKKEIYQLREQIAEMQMLQKKFLGSTKKQTMKLSLNNQRS